MNSVNAKDTNLRIVHLRRIAFELLEPRPVNGTVVDGHELPQGISIQRLRQIRNWTKSKKPLESQVIEFIKSAQFHQVQNLLRAEITAVQNGLPPSAAMPSGVERRPSIWESPARSNYDNSGRMIVGTKSEQLSRRASVPDGPEAWREQK